MAAIIIVIFGLLATMATFVLNPGLPNESYTEFGSNLVNSLSILWIIIVLLRNHRRSDLDFGRAMRGELSTILLMIFVSGSYSMLRLVQGF